MNVVVVDDDKLMRDVLARVVRSFGHVAFVAETADAALDLVELGHIDVVVSDWMMPGRDGMDLCRLIRSREPSLYVYFILVTAFGDREHASAALGGGVDDFLVKPVDPFELRLRLIVAERVTGLHRRLAEQMSSLEQQTVEEAASARIDPLTELGNRRKMEEDLNCFRARRDRYGHTFGVALFDVDHFKTLNDTAGHQAGDEALRLVAGIVRRELREVDLAFRFGGEEILVVLPAGVERIATVADRIRRAVEVAAIAHPGRPGPEEVVTVSAGVAAGEGDTASFLASADGALYRAKAEGRNRITVAGPQPA